MSSVQARTPVAFSARTVRPFLTSCDQLFPVSATTQQNAHAAIPPETGLALDHSWPVHLLKVYVATIRNCAAQSARWTHRCTLTVAQARAPCAHDPEQCTHDPLKTVPCCRAFVDHSPQLTARSGAFRRTGTHALQQRRRTRPAFIVTTWRSAHQNGISCRRKPQN